MKGTSVHPNFPSDQFTIFFFCQACGRDGRLDGDRIPPDVTVQEIPKRLHCSRCGAEAGSIRGIYIGAGSSPCG